MEIISNINNLRKEISVDIWRALEIEFLGKPVNQQTINNIGAFLNYAILDFISKNSDPQADNKNIEFEIIGNTELETIKITPKNFFTALLMKDIYYPPAKHGATSYETSKGIYSWDSAGHFGFCPKEVGEFVKIEINLRGCE